MSGKFIVFEGVDNSGKSTLIELVEQWLKGLGKKVISTKHPGATPVGKALRNLLKHETEIKIDPNTEALVFAADNSAFINQVLRPSLENETWVLGDRNNFISSMAYQIASGCSFDQLDAVHAAIHNPPKIDLLFILKCDWETSQERKRRKFSNEPSKDRFEDQGRPYFDKVMGSYDKLMEAHSHRLLKFVRPAATTPAPTPLCLYIDASQPVEAVFAQVQDAISSLAL